MADDRAEAISALLVQTEEAHGAYERAELKGVYDEEWPQWYAAYAVDNGLGALLGHEVTTEDLAAFLASDYAEFQKAEPTPTEPWASHAARRIVTEL